ncbi:MAG: trehalose-phosphatase [Bdellovibrionota bacterium]
MNYVFSPSGLSRLEALRGEPTLFAFDFDGTLAPIVANAFSAKIPATTTALLEELSSAAPVAAVTGRPLEIIRTLVPASFRAWAGDHGAEIFPRRFAPAMDWRVARATVKKWNRDLSVSLAGLPGVWIEVKELSLSVHFRESPNRAVGRRKILEAVARLTPAPRALPGKCVVNLLNPRLPHKGNAVQTLMRGLNTRRALYVGDDANDEDVFALADPRILTIRIGQRAESRASLFLRRQNEIDRLLRLLLSLKAGTRYVERR